jgi:hypothetical protein
MAQIFRRMSRLTFFFIAGWLVTLASPAAAATYVKFYSGGSGYSGVYNGAGTVYNDTKGNAINCPTGSPGCGGSDILSSTNGTLVFAGFGNTITASVNTGNKVWDDLTPNFGGLGVGTGSPSDSDQIAGTDILTLSFATQVTLKGVATLFASGHEPFGPGSTATGSFQLFVDNVLHTVLFSDANNELLNFTGLSFAFMEGSNQPLFYVSALEFQPTPIPGALPLFVSGLGAMGLLLRRRKRKAALAV